MKPKIAVSTKSAGLIIYIDKLPHLCIRDLSDYLGFQSWVMGADFYCIEFYLKHKTIRTEYNDFGKWSEILKQLDKI